jgi:hypothetical protein
MMHPHLPGPRPLAVPGIGFSQNISVGREVVDPAAARDLPPLNAGYRAHLLGPLTTALVWMPVMKSV